MKWLRSAFSKKAASDSSTQVPAGGASANAESASLPSGPSKSPAEILDELVSWVATNCSLTADEIDSEAHAYDSGYFSSREAMALLTWIDDSYNVTVTEFELIGRLSSLKALSEHLATQS